MSDNGELAQRVPQIAGVRVLCVGDVMLDRYIYGSVERISPEAPVPVLRITRETAMLGGAGNVVRNLTALGAEACFVSVVGRDPAGREVTRLLADESLVETHLLTDGGRPTTIKTRYVAGSQQLLRADQESEETLAAVTEADVVARAVADLGQSQALVLSDYGKGVLTAAVCQTLIRAARERGRIVVVDPKGTNYARYAGATVVTPNRRELNAATGMPTGSEDEIVAAARHLIGTAGVEGVLVTRSQDGMTLVRADGGEPLHVPAVAREVFDVSGAGDTVVATLAAALAAGIPAEDAVRLANAAAGVVVAKIGTAVARAAELAAALRSRELIAGGNKLLPLDALIDQVREWRGLGLRVGFTNGVFDLLHPGHVSLLRQARLACDRLVVGLNDDASVKRLKGPERPLQSETARAAVIGSLASVDAVALFAEDTPLALIEALRPDLLVKGADYRIEDVVGARQVEGWGGRVVLVNLEDGHSTTRTIARMTAGR